MKLEKFYSGSWIWLIFIKNIIGGRDVNGNYTTTFSREPRIVLSFSEQFIKNLLVIVI